MNPSWFRFCAVLSFLTSLGAFHIDNFVPSLISEQLTNATNAEIPPFMKLEGWVAVVGIIGIIGVHLAAIIGLVGIIMFKRWGRELSLWSTVVLIIAVPIGGPVVMSGFSSSVSDFAKVLWGAVLAVAYFGPIHARFDARNEA